MLLVDALEADEGCRRLSRQWRMKAFLLAKARRTTLLVHQKRMKARSLVTASQATPISARREQLYR
jgi:hypothetical protein